MSPRFKDGVPFDGSKNPEFDKVDNSTTGLYQCIGTNFPMEETVVLVYSVKVDRENWRQF